MSLASDLMLKLIIAAQDATQPAVSSVRQGLQSISVTAEKVYTAAKAYLTFQIAIDSANKLAESLKAVLSTGGQFERYGASLQSLMGGVSQGKQALAWIQQFARETPFELDGVMSAFVKLKSYGLDPTDGSLRAIAEQTAKTGGGQEELAGIVLALGQAWSKQKLQAEEANQLLERGVPVWDMMAKAMGKSTAEVMALSEAGALGRKEIRALIETMGASSQGALEAQMKTWNGLVSNLKDNWTQFLNTVASSGTLDYFKAKVEEINRTLSAMAASGELQAKAEMISNAFVSMGKSAGNLVDHFGTMAHAAEALAYVYLGNLAKGLGNYAASTWNAIAASKAHTAQLEEARKVQAASLVETQKEAAIKASITRNTLNQAQAEAELAKAYETTQKARLADAQASTAAMATAKQEVIAAQAAVEAAQKRVATAKTIQGSIAAEQALSQAIQNQASTRQALGVAETAHAKALDNLKTRQMLAKAATQEAEAAQQRLAVAERAHAATTNSLSAAQKAMGEATAAAAASASLAQKAMLGISALANAFVPALVALQSLAFAWMENSDALEDYRQRQTLVADGLKDSGEAHIALRQKIRETLTATKDFADTAILSGAQFSQQSKQQGQSYLDSLEKAQRYWLAIANQDKLMGNMQGMDEAERKAQAYALALEGARTKLDGLAQAADKPVSGVLFDQSKVNAYADALKGAKDDFEKYAKTLSTADLSGVIEGARQRLDAVKVATGDNSLEMQRLQGIIDSALRQTMTRAGVDAERALTGVSSEMRKAIADTEAMGKALKASGMEADKAGKIMVDALSGLLGKAKTAEDLKEIKIRLDEVANSAKQGSPLFYQLVDANTKLHESEKKVAESTMDSATALRLKAEATEKAKVSAQAAELTQYEIDRAARIRQNVQNAAYASAAARAKQREADAAKEIHDGEQLTVMYDVFTAALLQWGDAGKRAMSLFAEQARLSGSFNDYFNWSSEWVKLAQAQQDEAERLESRLRKAAETGIGLGAALRESTRGFDKLDSQRLEGLNAAIDAAKSKMKDLEASTRNTLVSLQDELDQLEGNTKAIERRRYEERQAKLKKLAEEARASNDMVAIQNTEEALRLAEKINRRKQARTDAKPADSPSSQATTRTVRHEFVINGRTLPVDVAENSSPQLENLLRELNRLQQVSR